MAYVFKAKFSFTPRENGRNFDLLYNGNVIPVRPDGVWVLGYTGYFGEIYERFRNDLNKVTREGEKTALEFDKGFPQRQKIRLEKLVQSTHI